jgi:integrase/recombinase XerD
VRAFRLHLMSNGAGTPKINITVSALRFFFKVTLDRPRFEQSSMLTANRKKIEPQTPEQVISIIEVARREAQPRPVKNRPKKDTK